MKIYDGSVLKLHDPKDRQVKDKIHQSIWEWYSYEMTRLWVTLWTYLKEENIPQKHAMVPFCSLI
jgi:hypothetical protein